MIILKILSLIGGVGCLIQSLDTSISLSKQNKIACEDKYFGRCVRWGVGLLVLNQILVAYF